MNPTKQAALTRSCAWSEADFFEFTERTLQLERPRVRDQAQQIRRDRNRDEGMSR